MKGLSVDQTPNSRINNDTLGVKGLKAAFLLKSWKVNIHKFIHNICWLQEQATTQGLQHCPLISIT